MLVKMADQKRIHKHENRGGINIGGTVVTLGKCVPSSTMNIRANNVANRMGRNSTYAEILKGACHAPGF